MILMIFSYDVLASQSPFTVAQVPLWA